MRKERQCLAREAAGTDTEIGRIVVCRHRFEVHYDSRPGKSRGHLRGNPLSAVWPQAEAVPRSCGAEQPAPFSGPEGPALFDSEPCAARVYRSDDGSNDIG